MLPFAVIARLPITVRRELDRRLVERDFKRYPELLDWLAQQGYRISPTSFYRYRKIFDQRKAAEELALAQGRVIVEQTGGDDALMATALARLVQHRLFQVLVDLSGPLRPLEVARLAEAISENGRVEIQRYRWAAEVEKYRARRQPAVAAEATTPERSGGLSPETTRAIRDLLLGRDPLASPAK